MRTKWNRVLKELLAPLEILVNNAADAMGILFLTGRGNAEILRKPTSITIIAQIKPNVKPCCPVIALVASDL